MKPNKKKVMKAKSLFFQSVLLLNLLLGTTVVAQESMIQRVDMGVQKNNQISLSVEGGFTFPFTDVQKPQFGKVVGVGLSYSPLSYIQIVGNLQKGYLTEGRQTPDFHFMNYRNSYYYAALMGRLSPLKIFKRPDEGIVKYLDAYGGLGVALIKSNVHTGNYNEQVLGKIDNYTGTDLLIPYEIGYSLPLFTFPKSKYELSININYRNHFSFSDKLDGYVPEVAANKSNDMFTQFTFGVVYSF